MVLIPERERICKLSRHLETVETGTDIVEGVYGTLDDDQYLEILEDEFKWGVL